MACRPSTPSTPHHTPGEGGYPTSRLKSPAAHAGQRSTLTAMLLTEDRDTESGADARSMPREWEADDPAPRASPRAGDEHAAAADDDESRREESTCPLCAVEEVVPETAGSVPSDNPYIRRILGEELVHSGVKPDHVIYESIARKYNQHIQVNLRRAGIQRRAWSARDVRRHYEVCVSIVPRRVMARQIRLSTRLLTLLDTAVSARRNAALDTGADQPPDLADLVDPKVVKMVCDVQAKLVTLVDKYRQFQREDQLGAGIATVMRSVELGDTSAADAAKLLESAAALRTGAGTGDRPAASELFS